MRNRNIEIIRAFAMLGMVFYHYTMVIGYTNEDICMMVAEVIGRFSLMTFFIISGYGTFHYYEKRDGNNAINSVAFLKKRLFLLAPMYWLILTFLLLFNMNAGFLDSGKIISPIIEYAFLSNLFPEMNFANGAAWTVSLMIQFYLASGIIYRIVCRFGIKGISFMCLLLIVIRVNAEYILNKLDCPPIYYTYASLRYPILTFDLYVLGMAIGKYPQKSKTEALWFAVGAVFLGLFIFALSYYGMQNGLSYTLSESYIVWRYGGALILTAFIRMSEKYERKCERRLLILFENLSKNSYGIYLCHMPLIANLLTFSPLFLTLKERFPILCLLIISLLAVISGTVLTQLSSSEKFRNNFLFC